MYEEKKGKIGRFKGATGRRAIETAEGSECFCEDDGRFSNGSDRGAVMLSGERALDDFLSAEKGRTVAG